MRAIVIHAAHDLRVEEQAVPHLGAGEVRIRLAAGGICGSDLHYFNHGGFGTVRLKEPMVLGHEVSGYIEAVGDGFTHLAEGDLVAISPSRPCGQCSYCKEGLHNHCENMRFYGSAMPFPHIQGAFREVLVADAAQCVKADGLSAGEAALAEPLSVALHAVKRAGDVRGKRVLVTGCGPIGVLVVACARHFGAADIVATDLDPNALTHAAAAGAHMCINPVAFPEKLAVFAQGKGTFHNLFECSGSEAALHSAISAMRPRGVIIQLGLGGDMTLPLQQMTAKELDLRGSFRFHAEFAEAVALMQSGALNLGQHITATRKLDEAQDAFALANDRSQSMKVQIDFA